MKIVGVAACTVGIAHTYIAREKLMEAAKKRGHEIHMETQGVIGIEDELDPKDIVEADVVILDWYLDIEKEENQVEDPDADADADD